MWWDLFNKLLSAAAHLSVLVLCITAAWSSDRTYSLVGLIGIFVISLSADKEWKRFYQK